MNFFHLPRRVAVPVLLGALLLSTPLVRADDDGAAFEAKAASAEGTGDFKAASDFYTQAAKFFKDAGDTNRADADEKKAAQDLVTYLNTKLLGLRAQKKKLEQQNAAPAPGAPTLGATGHASRLVPGVTLMPGKWITTPSTLRTLTSALNGDASADNKHVEGVESVMWRGTLADAQSSADALVSQLKGAGFRAQSYRPDPTKPESLGLQAYKGQTGIFGHIEFILPGGNAPLKPGTPGNLLFCWGQLHPGAATQTTEAQAPAAQEQPATGAADDTQNAVEPTPAKASDADAAPEANNTEPTPQMKTGTHTIFGEGDLPVDSRWMLTTWHVTTYINTGINIGREGLNPLSPNSPMTGTLEFKGFGQFDQQFEMYRMPNNRNGQYVFHGHFVTFHYLSPSGKNIGQWADDTWEWKADHRHGHMQLIKRQEDGVTQMYLLNLPGYEDIPK